MKKLIAAITLTIAAHQANANLITMNNGQEGGFVNAFNLTSFQIGAGSVVLPDSQEIDGGTVSFNMQSNQLRLVLNRHFACPTGRMCPMIMPAPIVVTLPVVFHSVSDSCGSSTTVAERNLLTTGGNMISVEVVDNRCARHNFPTMDLKPVEVTVTEQHGQQDGQIVSHLIGTDN